VQARCQRLTALPGAEYVRAAVRNHPWRPVRRAGVAAGVVVTLWLALAAPMAHADRDFSLRKTFNAHGDVAGTGNTLLTCLDSDNLCAAARAGNAGGSSDNGDNNNNSRPMTYVDIDSDASTFDSSSAALSLPAAAKVLWAGLYWGGRWQAGAGGSEAPNANARDLVKLRPPGATQYVDLASQVVPVDNANNREYQGFKEITGIVDASRGGRYTVANVQLGTGLHSDQSGGWAILVIYSNPGDPLRNMTVFDGMKFVTAVSEGGEPVDIPLSGFLTPPAPAPVKTRVGLVAYEGDIGILNDSALLNFGAPNEKALQNPANPPKNFFNSSISDPAGTILSDRDPSNRNTFGFDADFFESDQYLSNGQTATTLRLTTTGDGYAPGAVLFSTDLFAPKIEPVKTVDKTQAELGDVLTYQITVPNTGLDPATNVVLTDAIPPNTDYLAGSLSIDGVQKTDAPADDQAEFVSDSVVFRLGSGATSTTGGELVPGASTTVQFQVRVHSTGLQPDTQIVNGGTVGFKSKTLGEPGSEPTNEVTTTVIVPDLELQKTHTGDIEAGGSATYEIAVRNVGKAPTQGLTVVTDDLPPKVTLERTPSGAGWACTATTGGFRCQRSDVLAPGDSFPTISARVNIAEDAAPSTLVNTATVRTPGDPNKLNDTDTDEGEVRLPDLAIQKTALTPEVVPEGEVRYLITVLNRGPVRATNVVVTEPVPPDLTSLTVKPSKGTCSDGECRLGTLLKGDTVTIEVSGVADRDSGGHVLVNRVRVDAKQPDLNPKDNDDDAIVHVTPVADIVVEKTAAAPTLVAGGIAQFLVVVRNDGPSTATNVTLQDIVPPGLEPVGYNPSQGTCADNTCSLGTLADGGVAEILVFLRTFAEQAGQTFVNVARAAATEFDPNLANNEDDAPITLTSPPPVEANLVVTKTADKPIVTVGDVVTFNVTAENQGPGTATNVMLSDGDNPAVEILSADPSQGTCVLAKPTTCEIGTLAPGARATLVVRARVVAAGLLRNVAAVISPQSDPNITDSLRVAPVVVRADVRLRKRANRPTVRSGGRVSFTMTAEASGVTEIKNAVICDRMPSRLSVVDMRGGRLVAGRVCWRVGRLEPGRPRTVRLVTRAQSVSRLSRVLNLARLTGDGVPAGRLAVARVRILPARARPGGVTG
jgi:uncharacterized repeat protein (TIGR01451 family)